MPKNEIILDEISKRLHKARIDSGLTLEEVAKKVGVSTPAIHKYEHGAIANIPMPRIQQLADIYNVSPAWIMGWDEPKEHHKTPHEELAELVDQRPELYQLVETAKFLPPDGVKRMIRLVKFNIEEEKNDL